MSDLDDQDTSAQPDQSEQTEAPAEVPVQAPVLTAFTYPTLGVTIFAKDQADADAQAAVHPLNPKNA
jgi:hypothetical protein